MHWKIGARIREDILGQERAAYGEQIVSTLSRQLSGGYGLGFSRQNLFHMIRFVEAWPDEAEAADLAQHMGWSHLRFLLELGNSPIGMILCSEKNAEQIGIGRG